MSLDPISYKKAMSVQEQLDQAIARGDQLAETQQARVDSKGKSHSTLKQRLDSEQQENTQRMIDVTSQLADNADKLAKRTPWLSISEYEDLVIDGDWTPAFLKAIANGKCVRLDVETTIKTPLVITKRVRFVSDYEVVNIDWNSIGERSAIMGEVSRVVFENIEFRGNDVFQLNDNRNVIDFNLKGGKRLAVKNCISNGNVNFVVSRGSGNVLEFTDNVVNGLLADDLTIETGAAHTGVRVYDGKGCKIQRNELTNLSNGVILSLSTDESIISNNIVKNSGNNSIYVSSGNRNIIKDNQCEGLFSVIKVRGDGNNISGNIVVGTYIDITNAIVDYKDGYGITNVTVSNNQIYVKHNGQGLKIGSLTNYDCKVKGINVTNNIIKSYDGASDKYMLYGISFQFVEAEDCKFEGNIIENTLSHGIVSSSIPYLQSAYKRIIYSNNSIRNCLGGNGINTHGDYITIDGNKVYDVKATGGNSGSIRFQGSYSQIVRNTLQKSSEYGIQERTGSDWNIIKDNVIAEATNTPILKRGGNTVVKDNLQNGAFVA